MRDTRREQRILTLIVVGFCLFCGVLVVESGLLKYCFRSGTFPILLQQTTEVDIAETINTPISQESAVSENSNVQSADSVEFGADHAQPQTIILGAVDPNTEDPETGFPFQLELSTKGAAIRKATFSNGNNKGFDDRDPQNPQPLMVINPVVQNNGSEILAMANREFEFLFDEYNKRLALQDLHWQSFGVENSPDGSQSVRFEAIIKIRGTDEQVIKLIKTYKV